MKKMFEEFRKVKADVKIAWHTCGSVIPIIPDFIEIGLDILNPLQSQAASMDPENLTSRFGRDLAFFGGIDIQNLLPFSTPEKIRSEVHRIANIFGKNYGYMVGPAHHIQVDTPPENIIALFEAVKEL
jgi:uroporphyrinogen decarboxylase